MYLLKVQPHHYSLCLLAREDLSLMSYISIYVNTGIQHLLCIISGVTAIVDESFGHKIIVSFRRTGRQLGNSSELWTKFSLVPFAYMKNIVTYKYNFPICKKHCKVL